MDQFGSDQGAIMNDLENSQSQYFEHCIAVLENAIQSLVRDYDVSRIFQAGLEQRLRQIERRLDALTHFPRATETRSGTLNEAEECESRVAAVELRLDILEKRRHDADETSKSQRPLSCRMGPSWSGFGHGQGKPTVGRDRFASGRKRQRADSRGQRTGNDGDWLFGSGVDLVNPVQNGAERVKNDRAPFCTTLLPRKSSLDLQ